MNLRIHDKLLHPAKKHFNKVKTFWSNYNNILIKKLLSYQVLRRKNYFTWIGFFMASLIAFVLALIVSSFIKTYNNHTSHFKLLSTKLEEMNPYFDPHKPLDDSNVKTESLNLEMEVVKIEKGKFGTREQLRPKHKVILSFRDLSSLLNFISSSPNHMVKNITIKKLKGSNDQFEVDFIIVKTSYNI